MSRQVELNKRYFTDAFWAYRTTYKTSLEMSPYKVVYRKTCHIFMELEYHPYWDIKKVNFNY